MRQRILVARPGHYHLNDMSPARLEESKQARTPANLLFEAMFDSAGPQVMVGDFQCLQITSRATPRSRLPLTPIRTG